MILLYYLTRMLLVPLHLLVRGRMARLDAKHKRLGAECDAECRSLEARSDAGGLLTRTVAWAAAGVRLARLDERRRRAERYHDWYLPVESRLAALRRSLAALASSPRAAFVAGIESAILSLATWDRSGDILDIATEAIRWTTQFWGGGA